MTKRSVETDTPERRGSKARGLALRRKAAAAALDISVESFDAYVRPALPVVYLGSVRVYPLNDLEAWLAQAALAPSGGPERIGPESKNRRGAARTAPGMAQEVGPDAS
jgi:hypothetical protein